MKFRRHCAFAPLLVSSCVAILLLFCSALAAQEQSASAPVPAEKPRTIDLSPIGYQLFSEMARRSGSVNLSLDFLDDDRILFTFNSKKLFSRHPDCPSTHDDRMVRAVVLDVSIGKVVSQVDWYLHDSRRYVWPLGNGRILIRRLNSFFLVDSDFHEKLVWTSPKDLLWVSVTPDGKQLITETSDDEVIHSTASKARRGSKSPVQIEFRDVDSMAVQRLIHSDKPANVEALSSGVASVVAGFSGKVWLVRFGANERQRTNIARVRTRRIPDILYLNSNTLLIGRDSISMPGYSVTAFTVAGNRLWRQHWAAHRYDPTLARSEDGSRFAVSTLKLVDAPPSGTDEGPSEQEGLEQHIEVVDTASGTHVLSANASPIVLQGQNFALSPDGQRFAVLHGTQIEVFDLPALSLDERAKYSAVKADVPGLYISPPDQADGDTQSMVFTSAAGPAETKGSDSPPPPTAQATSNEQKASDEQATDKPATPEPTVTMKTSAQVVALDVVVTNSSGRTVKSVPREAFQVREDGKPQTISYFGEVEAHPTGASAQRNEVAPNIFTNDSPATETESVTLILYDLLNTPADQQQRAKLELLKFLQNKPKHAKFALCALSESLQLVQGFTPDENLLMRAAKGQKGSLRFTSTQTQEEQDQQTISWLTQGSSKLLARGSQFGPMATAMLDTAGRMEQEASLRRGRDLETRAWLTMDAFAQLARYLSAIPGRKSLIWLSGSFPLGIFPGVDLRNSAETSATYTQQVQQAVNLLAEAHIAVYPVDVRGLTAYSMQTPSFDDAMDSNQPSATSPLAPSSETRRYNQLANLSNAGDIGSNLPGGDSPFMQEVMDHGIMDRIAADTGGKAFYNSNGIQQAMVVAMEQERNYYALSYSSTNKKYDGKFRKIAVSLTDSQKKLHLIYRSGYYAVDPLSVEGRDTVRGFGLAAMQHGSPQAHQIVFAARVVPIGKSRKIEAKAAGSSLPSKKQKRHKEAAQPEPPVEVQHYVVDYVITPSQLRFDLTSEGMHHGITNFMITSFADDGAVRTSSVSRAVSDFKADGYQEVLSGGLRFRQQLDIPVQATSLRLGVQDGLTGRMGTLEIPLPVRALPGVEQSLAHRMPEIEPD